MKHIIESVLFRGWAGVTAASACAAGVYRADNIHPVVGGTVSDNTASTRGGMNEVYVIRMSLDTIFSLVSA